MESLYLVSSIRRLGTTLRHRRYVWLRLLLGEAATETLLQPVPQSGQQLAIAKMANVSLILVRCLPVRRSSK